MIFTVNWSVWLEKCHVELLIFHPWLQMRNVLLDALDITLLFFSDNQILISECQYIIHVVVDDDLCLKRWCMRKIKGSPITETKTVKVKRTYLHIQSVLVSQVYCAISAKHIMEKKISWFKSNGEIKQHRN